MNQKTSFLTIWIVAATAVIGLFGGSDVMAENPVCARSSPGPQICVFKNGTDPDPEPDQDFFFDLTDPAIPPLPTNGTRVLRIQAKKCHD